VSLSARQAAKAVINARVTTIRRRLDGIIQDSLGGRAWSLRASRRSIRQSRKPDADDAGGVFKLQQDTQRTDREAQCLNEAVSADLSQSRARGGWVQAEAFRLGRALRPG